MRKPFHKGVIADTPQLVEPSSGKVVPLSEAINTGLVDPMSGKIRDDASGTYVPLDEAKGKGIVKSVEIDTTKACRPGMSLQEAILQGHFDPATMIFTDPATAKNYDLAEAITASLIDPSKKAVSPDRPQRVESPKPVLVTETVESGFAAAVADKHEGVEVEDTVPLMRDVAVDFRTPPADMVDAATGASVPDELPKVVPSLKDARRVSSEVNLLR